jgi:serine-type D-Ala-D-Ala carboxypeptidase
VTGDAIEALLADGVAARVFPMARAVVRHQGAVAVDVGASAATDTVFDLASLTKVMATTAVFLSCWAEGRVEPATPVARWWPESPAGRAGVTLADLLTHRAGLPAFEPFFAGPMRESSALRSPACPPALREATRRLVIERALTTPLEAPPRTRAVYSDVGFLVLGQALAEAGGDVLDALFVERVARPLGLSARFRRLSATTGTALARPPGPAPIAPTGGARPREPAPGQEGRWPSILPVSSPPGEVDDDNAWVMDGVAGHAGLFGTAADVAAFGQAVLDELDGAGRIAPGALWAPALERDVSTPGSTRAFGFDTRHPADAAADLSTGRFLGRVPPGAVGHLGFTGVSLWIDLGRRLVVALCTNRTALGRAETRIRDFRPSFHDAVVRALGLAG